MERTAVIHAHDDALPGGDIGHARVGGQRQCWMRRSHGVHVVSLAGGGLAVVKFSSVPRGDAALLVGAQRGRRNILAPEYRVGAIGEAMERLEPWRGVGNRLEIGRWIGARAVILVIAAAFGSLAFRGKGRRFATGGRRT